LSWHHEKHFSNTFFKNYIHHSIEYAVLMLLLHITKLGNVSNCPGPSPSKVQLMGLARAPANFSVLVIHY